MTTFFSDETELNPASVDGVPANVDDALPNV
jgi:hypothetical protein